MGFDPESVHQPPDAFAVDLQRDRHPAAAEERPLQVEFGQASEQAQGLGALRPPLGVEGRGWGAPQFALLLNRQVRMRGVDPSAALLNR